MCSINPDYEPEIYQVKHYRGTQIGCYFTNGDVRRYDIASAIARGGEGSFHHLLIFQS